MGLYLEILHTTWAFGRYMLKGEKTRMIFAKLPSPVRPE